MKITYTSISMLNLEKNFDHSKPYLMQIFVAENQLIMVQFIKNCPSINFLEATIGPFKKGSKAKLKIWVALLLRKTKFCSIDKPFWLKKRWLKRKIFTEKKKNNLQPLPFNYLEIFYTLKGYSKEVIFNLEQDSLLIEELYYIRITKILHGIQSIAGNITFMKLDKICFFEMFKIKRIIQFILLFFSLINI